MAYFSLLLTDNSKKILNESILQSKALYKIQLLNEQQSNKLLLEAAEEIVVCYDLGEYGAGKSKNGMDLD